MTLSLTYKGFNYVSYYNGGFENADSLPTLAATGANSVALTIDYGIDAQTSTVYADPDYTDSLTALSDTILQSESLGLSVMVRPLIDLVNETLDGTLTGDWRDTYEPTDPTAFFASYESMILAVATIAQQDGAQSLCIGTELDQLTGPQYLSEWTAIISAVRAVFSGQLTYSATWDDDISPWTYSGAPAGSGDTTTQISFWNQLDAVGIDEYAPISDAADPTLQQLIDGWTEAPTDPTTASVTGGASLIDYYETIAAELDKPLLFTELGYQNATDGALAQPQSTTNVQDDALQGSLYTAFFDAWREDGNTALAGIYFWNWDPNAAEVGPDQGINWSPQGLPAEAVVSDNYMACYAAGTRIATATGETPVEALRVGDLVRTHAGALRPIIWIGQRCYPGRAVAADVTLQPVLIRAGALADGIPGRDLLVSQNHALLLDGVLIPAGLLINGASISQRVPVGLLRYVHIELDRHDILLAEGAPAESYLDTGNRACFFNGPAWLAGHPDVQPGTQCAELLLEGPRLAQIKQRLFARGADAKAPVLTLQARVAAAPLLPVSSSDHHHEYAVPPDTTALELRSAPFIPACCIANSLDRRRLGVRFCEIAIDGSLIPLSSPLLQRGFHAAELTSEGRCRWTDGDATLTLPPASRRVMLKMPDAVSAHPLRNV